jgi:hypothetical protein
MAEIIKACPFCGSTTAPALLRGDEITECDENEHSDSWAMVCDAHNGGCGGAAGYHVNPDSAVQKWNARAWRPLEDDGDSRRLEIACLSWCEGHIITMPESVERAVSEVDRARRSGNREWYRCSVFDLAVAIGKVISAGDAIDGGGV